MNNTKVYLNKIGVLDYINMYICSNINPSNYVQIIKTHPITI